YQATRIGSPGAAWAAGVERTIGDVVEPTVYNGYKYTVTATTGANPTSGLIEPDWPTESGAQIIEYAQYEGAEDAVVSTVPDPNVGTTYPGYTNPAGGRRPRLIDGGFTR